MTTRSKTPNPVLTFDEFFETAEPLLRRALIGGFGPDLGREATSEALTYGWKNWERITGLDNPNGYLYRVGERWALRYLNQPLMRSSTTGEDPMSKIARGTAESGVSETALPSNTEPGLAAALKSLSLRQRQVVVLVASFGLSHSEAADLLGISRSSIQNHVERGMKKLRTSLGVEA